MVLTKMKRRWAILWRIRAPLQSQVLRIICSFILRWLKRSFKQMKIERLKMDRISDWANKISRDWHQIIMFRKVSLTILICLQLLWCLIDIQIYKESKRSCRLHTTLRNKVRYTITVKESHHLPKSLIKRPIN